MVSFNVTISFSGTCDTNSFNAFSTEDILP